ncbi:MAG: hypothetical protein ACKVZH_16080 [Blastocatellia bacterium]
MPTLNSFPYHRQDDEAMCGPACAQMVLDYLGDQVPIPDQEDFRKKADALPSPTHTVWENIEYDKWATRPDELEFALRPLGNPLKFTFDAYYKGSPGSYKSLLSTGSINNKSQACPIVPVHGAFYYKQQFDGVIEAKGYSDLAKYDANSNYDAHWVVFFKYESNGFVGNDPYFPLTKGAFPHSNHVGEKKDGCKTVLIHVNGDKESIRDINFPVINRAAVLWKPRVGENQRIALPFPTEAPPIERPFLPPAPLRMTVSDAANQPFNEASARGQMNNFGLFTRTPCNTYLSGTTFGTPRLVHRLDVFGRDYYLVPMLKPDGNSTAMIRVDAPTGEYLDSLYYSENPFLFDKSKLRQARLQSVIQQLTQFDNKWGKAFSTQISEPATEMVWLPCKQSRSAFFPFYIIKLSDPPQPERRVLVRVDWQLFLNLTY